jgi:hypothetical protein
MSMPLETSPAPPSKLAKWTGRVLSGLLILANLMGAGMNLSQHETAVKGAAEMGYPADAVFGIGVALLLSTVLFAVPKTAVLGALFLTGYLGGAVATHIRAGQGWSTTIAAFVFAVVMWVALLLREPRLRAVLPLRKG